MHKTKQGFLWYIKNQFAWLWCYVAQGPRADPEGLEKTQLDSIPTSAIEKLVITWEITNFFQKPVPREH